jgi:DNA modification methylase
MVFILKIMDLFGNEIKKELSLADKYLMCPTSVLNKRDPKWSELKRKWLKLGIKSELGRIEKINKDLRGSNKENYSYMDRFKYEAVGVGNTFSIFDPVLCEIIYKWFCPDGGKILDPFAGGSVRGIVANKLGFKYTGIELREQQCLSNREQAIEILEINNQPQWYCGDSDLVLNDKFIIDYDLLFSCPPYMGLEVYSDLPEDLSNMKDVDFEIKYNSIIKKSCNLLKKGGYAVFVVGDLRDKKGYQKDFTGMTKQSFIKAGMKLYNELILIEPVGSKAMTLERGFKNGKLAKVHQNVYIFVKP